MSWQNTACRQLRDNAGMPKVFTIRGSLPFEDPAHAEHLPSSGCRPQDAVCKTCVLQPLSVNQAPGSSHRLSMELPLHLHTPPEG